MAKSAPKRASNPNRQKKYETQKSRTEANKARNREKNEAARKRNEMLRAMGKPTPVQIKSQKRLAKRALARGKVTPLNVQRANPKPTQGYDKTAKNIATILREGSMSRSWAKK